MTSNLELDSIVFLDIEASGLGPASFPVEVGWASLTGGSGSLLIRPEPDWELSAWDEMAEALHGLSLAQLQRDGHPARDVAEALNRLLGQSPPLLVLSDAPAADSAWLRVLYDTTPRQQAFELQDEARARQRLLGSGDIGAWAHRLPKDSPNQRAHRAQPDACRLAVIWRASLGRPLAP